MIDKIKVKGVEYEIGGSGGSSGENEIIMREYDLEIKYQNEEDEFISGELELGANSFDFSRPFSIDFFDKDDNWLHCATYTRDGGWSDLYVDSTIQDGDASYFIDSMLLESSGDTYYWDASHTEGVAFILFSLSTPDDEFMRLMKKTAKVKVYGYKVTKCSPTTVVEI